MNTPMVRFALRFAVCCFCLASGVELMVEKWKVAGDLLLMIAVWALPCWQVRG